MATTDRSTLSILCVCQAIPSAVSGLRGLTAALHTILEMTPPVDTDRHVEILQTLDEARFEATLVAALLDATRTWAEAGAAAKTAAIRSGGTMQ